MENQNMYLYEMITNLEKVSDALSKMANEEKDNDPKFIEHLESISWEMHKYANELKVMEDEYIDIPNACTCATGCFKCLGMSMRDFL
jgi:uncharacterized protein Yka (UPF0111/DUF47 family)